MRMKNEEFPLPIDATLTYGNASSRGYQWEVDLIRNEQGDFENLEEAIHLVNEEGYKIGQSWAGDPHVAPYGLYKPIRKRDESTNSTKKETTELRE